MLRIIGFLYLIFALVVIFIAPLRHVISDSFLQIRNLSEERKLVGNITVNNPRIVEIQEILNELGFNTGLIRGTINLQTRATIRAFQKAEGLDPTGKIDPRTLACLNRQMELKKSAIGIGQKSKLPPNEETDTSLNIKEDHVRTRADIQDEIIGYRLRSKDKIKDIQTALRKAGFYEGKIDGRLGLKTKEAIKAFQKSKNLYSDGIVGPKTFAELKKYLED